LVLGLYDAILARVLSVRVRIVRQPVGFIEGISLRQFHPDQVYDIDTTLAEYLVLEGYARLELRKDRRSSDRPLLDRRKNSYTRPKES